MVGDLANGRTVRSLCMCLSMYPGVEVFFVAPDVVRMRDDVKVRSGAGGEGRMGGRGGGEERRGEERRGEERRGEERECERTMGGEWGGGGAGAVQADYGSCTVVVMRPRMGVGGSRAGGKGGCVEW